MEPQSDSTKTSWLNIPEEEFLSKLTASSKYKERSHQTYHTIHLPELNTRLNLNINLPPPPPNPSEHDPFTPQANLSNTSKIETIYLGNSMLERLKTTGASTRLGNLCAKGTAWNAGCGGDKNENIAYRLGQGMYTVLKEKSDVKLWVLASGTNNLHAKRGFREADVRSWRVLVESCLRIAPRSRVLACDVFYRKDVADGVVEECNAMLKGVVEEVNGEIGEERVVWVEARRVMGRDMLGDHVHLNEEGYRVWDEVL